MERHEEGHEEGHEERHEFDAVSFLFGLLFVGLAGAYLIAEETSLGALRDWFWPSLLVAGGVVVLATTLTARSSGGEQRSFD